MCHKPLEATEVRRIGARTFCETHHTLALASEKRVSWSRIGLIELAATAVFVLAMGAGLPRGVALPAGIDLLLAIVPALFWFVYVYRQDRLEPEPPGLVIGIFLLTGLITWSAVLPLAHDVLDIQTWQFRATHTPFLASLILASASMFVAYLTVRYTIYLTSEFDEPMDGIVYMTAACLGAASAHNLYLLATNPSVEPLSGASRLAVMVLVYVAAAIPLGLVLGTRNLKGRARWRNGGAFLLSVAIAAGVPEGIALVSNQGGRFRPTFALTLGLAAALIVLVVGHLIASRLRTAALSESAPTASQLRLLSDRRGVEPLIWLDALVLLLLTNATGVSTLPQKAAQQALAGRVTLTLPTGWTGNGDATRFEARPSTLATHAVPQLVLEASSGSDADLAMLHIEEQHRRAGTAFRVLKSETAPALGRDDALWSWFAMVEELGDDLAPVVVTGVDIVASSDEGTVSLSIWGPPALLPEPQVLETLSHVRTP